MQQELNIKVYKQKRKEGKIRKKIGDDVLSN